MNKQLSQLSDGLQTAFLNDTHDSAQEFRPELISNDHIQGKKVLVSLEQELLRCDSFGMSVAFITKSGITPLLQTLKELEKRNIPGRILTTDYLRFSEPEALMKLASLNNIELRMFRTNHETGGFHTKGYIFKQDEIYRIVIGSANLTLNAMTKNKEWNTKIIASKDGSIVKDVLAEFERLWNHSDTQKYDEFMDTYQKEYAFNQWVERQYEMMREQGPQDHHEQEWKPNRMQEELIKRLIEFRQQRISKALLISATGTGKTYAAAFAMRELHFRRVLFLVHRNLIAKQAMRSFHRILPLQVTMGQLTGKKQEFDQDYIFATVQTLSKDDYLYRFSPNHFDAIIYDEAHHAVSSSYRKIMAYFKPQFSLGMTATPDRRDDAMKENNVYQMFDHHIAYEIRLQQAMEEDLLCPFHYFGITDLVMIDDQGEAREQQLEHFNRLTGDARADYVMEQATYYGYSGNRVKGLIFCSRVEEAKELSRKFNARGWRTIALSGADPENVRSEAIDRLAMDETGAQSTLEPLDYILTVDVFSEGVDIIEVNQVIMLRPTQSPIVFIQQLGRGLRKAQGKEYVVVLDFIGNYKNNFMIPIALSGDRTYNKDNIRRYLMEGTRTIPGASTLHFDEIAKKRIFQAIDHANFNDVRLLKDNYFNLKNKLGHIPSLKDFDAYGEMDVLRIFDHPSLGSYHRFLVKYEKAYQVRLNEEEEKYIEFISRKLANGKRVHELELLSVLIDHPKHIISTWVERMKRKYQIQIDRLQRESVISILTNLFPSGAAKKTFETCIFLTKQEKDGMLFDQISTSFERCLCHDAFKQQVQELIAFGISRYLRDYAKRYRDTNLTLYQKYTYEDVCRLLNWEKSEVPLNIGGYKYDRYTRTFPVFINYEKPDDISDTTKYEDHFENSGTLIAISKSGRTLESEDVQTFLRSKESGVAVHLFVRKNKEDKISKEFYYMGTMTPSGKAKTFVMTNTDKTAVEIEWHLDTLVREDLFDYITKA